jgi:hypothetical protein
VVASTHAWTSGRLERQVRRRDIHGRLRDEDAPPAVLASARPDLVDASRRPAVDAYRRWLGAALQHAGVAVPGRSWAGKGWAVVPTVDVDLIRTRRPLAALGGDPRQKLLARLVEILAGENGASFFLKAGATAKYDVGYELDDSALDGVWQAARAGGVEIGLHPSYFAHDHAPRLNEEVGTLRSSAAARDVAVSPLVRNHYLRWSDPGTPRSLDLAGLKFELDSTLGFTTRAGFRRATATPFRLFDLDRDHALDLWELSPAVMDTALFVHGGARPVQEEMRDALAGAREAGGACVLVWHNEPRGRAADQALDDALAFGRDESALIGGLASSLRDWRIPTSA